MLNRKKNHTWVYVLIAVVAGAFLWGVSQEMPFHEEIVEHTLINTFAK